MGVVFASVESLGLICFVFLSSKCLHLTSLLKSFKFFSLKLELAGELLSDFLTQKLKSECSGSHGRRGFIKAKQ